VELPRLEPLYREYKEEGLSIIAIEGKRDRDRARKFIEEKGLTYTFLETGEGEDDFIREVFKIRAYPTTFLVDQEGRIMFVHVGFSAGDEGKIEKEIRMLM
jgi:peroxiredoxin